MGIDEKGLNLEQDPPLIFCVSCGHEKYKNSEKAKAYSFLSAVLVSNKEYSDISNNFPIKIKNKKELEGGDNTISEVFNGNLNEILGIIHGNFIRRDDLLELINNKYIKALILDMTNLFPKMKLKGF